MALSRELTLRRIDTAHLINDTRLPHELKAWKKLSALGCSELLRRPFLALFCSIRCPGKVILELYDLARALRDAEVSVVSGFHTPMEKECLELLLRGTQPIIICPARDIKNMRLSATIRAGIEAGRILLLSPFDVKQRRVTAQLSDQRNRLVTALAGKLFVAYATPGGKIEQLCREVVVTGKSVFTFDCIENANLLALGAKPTSISELAQRSG